MKVQDGEKRIIEEKEAPLVTTKFLVNEIDQKKKATEVGIQVLMLKLKALSKKSLILINSRICEDLWQMTQQKHRMSKDWD